jgi:hypothetical protein
MVARCPALAVLMGLIGFLALPAGGQTRHPVVEIRVASADADEVRQLEAVLRDVLRNRPIEASVSSTPLFQPAEVLSARPDSGSREVLGRTWIDLSAIPAPVIYFVDPRWQRVLVRRLPESAGRSRELAREAIGQVVLGAVEALLAGEPIGVPVDQAAALVSPPPPAVEALPSPASGSRRLRLDAGLMYEAQLYSEAVTLVQGPAIGVGAGMQPGESALILGLRLSLQARLPFGTESGPVGLRLHGGAVRLLATAEHPLGGKLAIRYLAGGGLDLSRVQARGGADAVWLAPEKYLLVPVVRAAAELRAHLSRMFALSFLLLADLDTSATRFVVEGGAEDVVLLRPFTVRPGIGLAVTTP